MVGIYSKLKLLESAKDVEGAASMINTIPSLPSCMASITKDADFISMAKGLEPVTNVTSVIGEGLNVVGGGLSALGLTKDIIQAVQDKKVTFDNAMDIADDATGLATSIIAAAVPGVGSAIALGIGIGEKAVTSIIKGVRAIKAEEKRLGRKLTFNEGAQQVLDANGMGWMSKDIGQAIKQASQPPPKNNPYSGMSSMAIAQQKRSGVKSQPPQISAGRAAIAKIANTTLKRK
jgi:hypothetical protein